MNRRTAAGATTVAALALAGAGLAGVAQASGGPDPQGKGGTVSAARKTGEGVTTCVGGKQKSTVTRINNQYTTFGEGTDKQLPGAAVWVRGPRHGKDTLDITFSAETQLRGSSTGDFYDWMELEVLVDGRPIQPYGPSDSPLAINGGREYASHAAQFCTRVGRGRHLVTVVSRLVDNGTDDTLTAWFDDTALHVETSD